MKLLYISYDGALEPLGQSQIIPYLKGLANKGVKFTLLTFEKKIDLRNKDRIRLLKEELYSSEIKWRYLKYHKRPSVPATIYDLIHGILVALWIAKKERIKIVHGRSFIGAVIALCLKKMMGIKFLLDLRGLWADERVDGNIFPKDGWLYKVSKYIEKFLLINADEIVVLTHSVRRIMEEFPYLRDRNLKIHVIPTCTNLKLFKPQKKSEDILKTLKLDNKFIFLYIGSLGTWYMLEEMIDFYCKARERISNFHFLFITPSSNGLIYDIMRKKGLKDLHFSIQSVAYADVQKWISVADASIFFIKPLFSKKSSCPTKFGESLACGIPVIINAGIGDCDDIVLKERVGVIINEFSLNEYERAIGELKGLLSEGDVLRKRCRAVAEKYFSLDMGVERYWEIYKILGQGPK